MVRTSLLLSPAAKEAGVIGASRIPFVHGSVTLGVRTPVSILRKSISGRRRPVRVADGPMTARCRFT